MMGQIMKKIFCSLLAILMVVSIAPVQAFASTPTDVNDAVVLDRLEKLEKLKGSFFTVDGTYCLASPGEPGHGCDNCESTYLIKTDLLDLMPSSRNYLPEYYLHGSGIAKQCWSCAAFASIGHWYLYAQKSTDVVEVSKIASGTFNSTTLANAKPGDIIGLTTASDGLFYHAMIFLSHTSNGIKVIDCNWGRQTYGNCYVQERTVSYSSTYNAAVSRATNYVEHSYDKYGYCSDCGKYYEEINKVTSIEGTATSTEKVYVKPHPYTGDSGVYQDELKAGTYKIIGRIENHYGNTWYKISYGSSKTGWIYPEDYITINLKNTVVVELNMNKTTIPKGTSVWANDSSEAYNWFGKAYSSNGVSKNNFGNF